MPIANDFVQNSRRVLSDRLALAERQLIHPAKCEDVWHVVRTDRVKVAHIARILHGRSPGTQTSFRAVIHEPGIGVSNTELQALAHAPVKRSLQGVVVAIAVWKIAPVNLVVLRPRSQGLGHCSAKPRVRGCVKSRRCCRRVRHTVFEERPQNVRSQGEHAAGIHVVIDSGGAAAINQPRPMVSYVGDIDRHVLAQLALERDRPVLIPGHGVRLGIDAHGISWNSAGIRYVSS